MTLNIKNQTQYLILRTFKYVATDELKLSNAQLVNYNEIMGGQLPS